eukprot:2329569-Prorocentrum_lima.AAC.1
MTSSLVGSEMCIRDSVQALWRLNSPIATFPSALRLTKGRDGAAPARTVSYTHLTLPTSVDLGGR